MSDNITRHAIDTCQPDRRRPGAVSSSFCSRQRRGGARRADLRLIGEFAIYVALASLWNLLAGYTGLVSVGQQAYVGLGGYVLFTCALFLGMNPLLAIPLAGLVAALAAVPVAKLVFRLQGAYFAIGTWVVAEVFRLSCAQVTGPGRRVRHQPACRCGQRPLADSRDMREWLIYWVSLALGVAIGADRLLACCARASGLR